MDLDFILGEGASFIKTKGANIRRLRCLLRLSPKYLLVLEPDKGIGEGQVEEDREGRWEAPA